jgi:hypothetical protein
MKISLLVTVIPTSLRFRANVEPTCYRCSSFSPFSGTCWPCLLPKFQLFSVFGHMLALLVTEVPTFLRFRAHVEPTCYRSSSFSPFSGICWPCLLPKFQLFSVFGHMLSLLVTEVLAFLRSRAHVEPTCYRSSGFSRFSGTSGLNNCNS